MDDQGFDRREFSERRRRWRRRGRRRHRRGHSNRKARRRNSPPRPRGPLPGYSFLNLEEAAFVEALVDHMVPADELTPKGTDIGLNIYIDRALAGAWGKGDRLYMQGPWKPRRAEPGLSAAAHARAALSRRHRGDQRALPQDLTASRSTHSTRGSARRCWSACPPRKITFEDGPPVRVFWTTVYQTVMEGMFSDPIYGGNRDKAGWKLIGFPGRDRRASRQHREVSRTSHSPPTILRHRGHELRGGDMVTKLKEVDVVVVGLGWTGGILSKELAEAGLKVVALERGDMRTTDKDFAVPDIRDELRYVVRHELMMNTARDTLTIRNNPIAGGAADAAARLVPAGRRRRRLGRALERPHLALDRHGIQGALHVRGALRQELHPRRHDDPGLGHHLRRARALLRQVRVHGGDLRQGRATSRVRSRPAAIRSRRRARANMRCRR